MIKKTCTEEEQGGGGLAIGIPYELICLLEGRTRSYHNSKFKTSRGD